MKVIKFSIALPGQKLKRYYSGSARDVVVKDYSGKTIQFPLETLRQFVTREGVYGEFSMTVDKDNKLVELKKLA